MGHEDCYDRLKPQVEVFDRLSIKGTPDANIFFEFTRFAPRVIGMPIC